MEEELQIEESQYYGGKPLAEGTRVLVADLKGATDYNIPYGLNDQMRKLSNTYVTIARTSRDSKGGMPMACYRIKEDNGMHMWNNFMFVIEEEPKKEDTEKETKEIAICLDEGTPSDEEIDKMISLVNLETFIKIIKNRCCKDGAVNTKEINEKVTEDLVKTYLRNWAISKYRFYKLFGEKLYIEEEIEIEKTNEFYSSAKNDIKHKYPLYAGFLEMVSNSDIAKNEMSGYSSDLLFEDSRIKKKMKFTKVAALFNDNDFNMDISKMYQDKNTKKLRISIEPCDYLTVSINRNGWRSCHNFFDGEWRNAGLSLMQDETSLVSYTYSNDAYEFKEKFQFTWNSKNWRQMVYISKDNSNLVFSLPYPNHNEELEAHVRKIIEDRIAEYLDIPNIWCLTRSEYAANISVYAYYMYNDIGRNGCKYAVNKFDKKRGTTLVTGVEELPGIVTGECVEGSCGYIW